MAVVSIVVVVDVVDWIGIGIAGNSQVIIVVAAEGGHSVGIVSGHWDSSGAWH
jgi:hypothetical protein